MSSLTRRFSKYQRHLKRLENIKNADIRKSVDKIDQEMERRRELKLQSLRFQSNGDSSYPLSQEKLIV